MGIGVGNIIRKRVKGTLAIDDENTLTFYHNPGKLTPQFEATIRDMDDEAVQSRTLSTMLNRVLVDWDLVAATEEDAEEFGVRVGDPIPLNRDNLEKLPIDFLIELAGATKKEQSPNPPAPQRSGSF